MRITWLKELTRPKDLQSQLGVAANALLKNEAFQAAMQNAEIHYTNMWKDSTPLDSVGREKLYLAIQIMKKLKQELSNYYSDYLVNQKNDELDRHQEKMNQGLNKVL